MLNKALKLLAAKADALNSAQLAESMRIINLIEPGMDDMDWFVACSENEVDFRVLELVFGELIP